jgi:phosphoglycolate phosphatase
LSVQGESKASTIATALRMLGDPMRAVMVGDRPHDIVGARSRSLPCIGVTWGIGSTKELRDAGADALVEVPAELAAGVDQLLRAASDGTGVAGQAL